MDGGMSSGQLKLRRAGGGRGPRNGNFSFHRVWSPSRRLLLFLLLLPRCAPAPLSLMRLPVARGEVSLPLLSGRVFLLHHRLF